MLRGPDRHAAPTRHAGKRYRQPVTDDAPTVTENETSHRYEATLADGTVAGFAAYERADGVTTFTHTIVQPQFEGRGIGSTLIRSALDAERNVGRPVVPRCEFVQAYIRRHPEYAELVASA